MRFLSNIAAAFAAICFLHQDYLIVVDSFIADHAQTKATSRRRPRLYGRRISIQEDYPSLKQLHATPDIFVIEDFIDSNHCRDLIRLAQQQDTMGRSPVAYAGWTQDLKELLELAATGPVVWLALISAWVQVKDDDVSTANQQLALVFHALQNYGVLFVVALSLVSAYTAWRAQGLKALRTSTSTTLNDLSEPATRAFCRNAARLFGSDGDDLATGASFFEAPTIIRYEKDQVLAPHFDANRSADTEDANRGGQTLATLLVYLNDVDAGGLTKFNRLNNLTVKPKRGDALLFFPADATGVFDESTEHEGCPAIDEKWIARIWRHQQRVPPPFGLSEQSLDMLR